MTAISLPSTTMPFSVALTSASNVPWTESYLRRCARVFVSVEVVDGDELEVLLAALERGANDAATDATEPVDCDARHRETLPGLFRGNWAKGGEKRRLELPSAPGSSTETAARPTPRKKAEDGAESLGAVPNRALRSSGEPASARPRPAAAARGGLVRDRGLRRGGGLRVLVAEVLRHEIDELGGEAQDLVRRVPVVRGAP